MEPSGDSSVPVLTETPRRNDARSALVVASTNPVFTRRFCGVTVLERLICALDRATSQVRVVADPDLAPYVLEKLRDTLAKYPTPPTVSWPDEPPHPSSDGVVALALDPVVIDHRVVQEALGRIDLPDRVLRISRAMSGGSSASLWILGPAAAQEVLAALDDEHPSDAIRAKLAAIPAIDFDPGDELCEPITAETATAAVETKMFRLGRKAADTWIASFDRRISLWFSRRLVHFPILPNQITVGSTAIGLAGALLLGLGTYGPQLIGALLLTFSIIVDGCDGEVARIKYMESDAGRRLDFFLDNVVNSLAIFTVGAGHYWNGGPAFYLWGSVISALAALGSVYPIYRLYFQQNKESIRLGAPPPAAPKAGAIHQFVEDISGRDFAYGILALAVFGKAYWFTWALTFCLPVFMVIALAVFAVRTDR